MLVVNKCFGDYFHDTHVSLKTVTRVILILHVLVGFIHSTTYVYSTDILPQWGLLPLHIVRSDPIQVLGPDFSFWMELSFFFLDNCPVVPELLTRQQNVPF